MATRVQLPPDTVSGWLAGAESPTHPKATHPVWLPSSGPPSSPPPTCWPPSPMPWEEATTTPRHRRQCPQHEWVVASWEKGDTEGVVPKPGSTFYRLTQGQFYKYTSRSPLLDALN